MQCSRCQHENNAAAKFCEECGARLGRTCAKCGVELSAQAKFCPSCGASLGSAPASRPSAQSPAVPASFASGRYQVQRFLGEGGKKRVYLARDTKLDRDVAVALIKTDGLDAVGRERIVREAQAMGRLGDHPHIVTVYDTSDENGQPYIVGQYMVGGDLDGLLSQAEDRRPLLSQALRIADQVCQALEHAHAQGIVHRDLKPGNIWLTQDGTAKLGDFGLAVALNRSRLTVAGMMVGTAAYIPPEQALGGDVAATSDLYALGCVLYEMVTGRPPFLGDDTVAVISQHLNTPPVAPRWHNPKCPAGLEVLILRLLQKDPRQRPASASEVRRALASIDLTAGAPVSATPAAAAPSTDETGGRPPASDTNPMYRRTFVGREAELKQLQAAFDAALSGHGSLVMVVGEPGIGKTTLTEHLGTYVTLRAGRTLVGHCYEEGSLALPYLPFVEAMGSYALERDGEQLARELGSGAVEVARIISEIRNRVAVELTPLGSPEEERFRLFQAVTTFLRNAADVQGLCIVLEDLHDGDRATLEMLVHLARNLAGARLLIVGTYRDVQVDRMHPLSGALAELRRVASFSRVVLRGLGPGEVHRMLSDIAGQEAPRVLADAVYRQTEGNPLFIQEVIRYAAEEGLIRREQGRWTAASADSLIAQIPEGLRDVIGKRLSRLGEACNKLLSIAAVIGREFAVDVLQAVAGVNEDDLLAALEEAVRVSVLEERSQAREARYLFTHAFFRQTLYEEMIAPRRLRLHHRVAQALEAYYASRVEDHAAELAEHFSHSSNEDDLRKAVRYGELAAQRAANVYAHSEAVRLLQQTLQVQEVLDPDDAAKRHDLLMALARSLLPAGEPLRVPETVAPEALEIAERLGDTQRAAQACQLALNGLAYHGAGPVFTTPEWKRWAERLDACAAPDSRERVMADAMTSWTYYGLREQKPCWELRQRALGLARRLGDPEALGFTAFSFVAPGAPLQLQAERVRVAEEFLSARPSGISSGSAGSSLAACATILVNAGKRGLADMAWRELDAHAHRVGDPYVRAWQVLAETVRLYLDGELEQAVEVAERFGAAASGLGIEVFGQLVSAWGAVGSLIDLGRFEQALALRWSWVPLIYGDAAGANTLAIAGRVEEAQHELHRIVEARDIRPDEDWTDMPTLVGLLATAVLVSDAEGAGMLARRLAGAAGWYSLLNHTTVARQLGLAAVLRGDPDAARSHFTAALDVAQRIRARPEVAHVRSELAMLLSAHYPDAGVEAAGHLDFAIAEFRAMKMQASLERALRRRMTLQGIDSSDFKTSIDAVSMSVQSRRPDLRSHSAPDGTVTLMFSDMEGFSAMTERLGDLEARKIIAHHNRIVREHVVAHGGFEVELQGDGFLLAFPSARRGVLCAIAIQRAFTAYSAAHAEQPIRVRIGLHTGEAIREADRFFGKTVILAARIAAQGQGGEILVSSLVKELTQSAGDVRFGANRVAELKGLAGCYTLHRVEWAG